ISFMERVLAVDFDLAFTALIERGRLSGLAARFVHDHLANGYDIIVPFSFAYMLRDALYFSLFEGVISRDSIPRIIANSRIFTPRQGVQGLARADAMAERFQCSWERRAIYLASAEISSCKLWVANAEFYNLVHRDLDWVHYLGDFKEVDS